MAVSLTKGEKVNLSKAVESLAKVTVGLGWDMATRGHNVDCDASVFVLRTKKSGFFGKEAEKLTDDRDVIYFGNRNHSSGCIKHHGDNLTGAGDGDDEQITIDLKNMPEDITRLVVVINIYNCKSRGQNFGMIKNCFARVVDNGVSKEICRYNLSNGEYDSATAMVVCEFYKENGEWHFGAVGEGTKDGDISSLARRYK